MYCCCCQVASVVSNSVRPHGLQPTRLLRPWDSPSKNTGVGCHFLLQCMKVESESEVIQLYLTLSHPMDCSPPGSSIHGIFWATVLEWGAIALSQYIYTGNPLKNVIPTDKSKKSSLNSTMKFPLCPFLISSSLLLFASPSNQIVVVIQVNIFACTSLPLLLLFNH